MRMTVGTVAIRGVIVVDVRFFLIQNVFRVNTSFIVRCIHIDTTCPPNNIK
jgi:hypothetical protein